MATPTTEPDLIVAGDTAKWLRSLDDYPASGSWVLSYTLVSAAQRYTFSATASGADHLVTVAATTTATWVAGTYTWRAQVSKAGEVYTVGTGSLTVRPSFATATDGRSHARRTLEAIEAVIEGRATSEVTLSFSSSKPRSHTVSENMASRNSSPSFCLTQLTVASISFSSRNTPKR